MSTPPLRSEFRHFTRIPTRWSDMDSVGHVNNTRYLTFEESSRIEYVANLLGGRQRWNGQGIILARVACDFVAQLKHPAQVDAAIRVVRLGRSSIDTVGAIFVGETCFARTEGVLVWFDYASQVSLPLPDVLRDAIRAFECIKPEESL